MAEVITIQPLNASTFELQNYSEQDTSLISNVEIQTSFDPKTDKVEYFIYDLNNQILLSNNNFPNFTLNDNNIVLDPEKNLIDSGFNEGQYNTLYNFVKPILGSDSNRTYFISQISPDRTEVRLDTTSIPDTLVVSSSLDLINNINTSTGSYFDFYLNFNDNNLIIAVNALLDTSSIDNPTVLIKLYEPLPPQFTINTSCWVVTQVAESVAYNININQIFEVIDQNINLKGPNFNLSIQDEINNSTNYTNYSLLSSTTSSLAQGTGSLQYQLNNLLAQRGISINIDYSDYSNFIHFSSAQTRLENFYYKLQLLEQYTTSASLSDNSSSGSFYVSSSNIIWQKKIDEIITGFDNYEYFLYYSSGSTSWPKTGNTPPYTNELTNSVNGLAWFTSQSLVAEEYDLENNNALILAIPDYIIDDPNNSGFELFIEMIGQLFDNVFVYYQDVTNKYDADNRLNYGVSKDLVADILRDLGLKIYQNNFSSNDLYQSLIGITPSGSLFNLPYTTTSLPVTTGSFLDYITTYVTASSTSSLSPTSDVNKSFYKRLYHNIPYLLKSKGTVKGLKTLISTFGVPNTILRVNEFGGKDKNVNSFDNWQDEYNYAFYTSGSAYVTSSFVLNSSWNSPEDRPSAIEFRFRTDGLPFNTGSVLSQSLWSTDNGVNLILRYTGSGYTSGSYSGAIKDPEYQYALLDFIPNTSSLSTSASIYLPFYDGGWWSVLVNSGSTGFTLYAANKNYKGEDGNVVGFQASSSVTGENVWTASLISTFGSASYKTFTGSFQEIRYYTTAISKDNFDAYVMNPYSIESSDYLAFRATLGGELYTESISVHPKVTGSWVATSSFASNSNFYVNTGGEYISNTEVIYFDQVPAGIQNAISQKIKQQSIILPYSSSNTNIPNADVLSPFISIQQFPSISESYTRDVDYVEIGFSPQNEINEDINSTFGYFNIGELIGDPRYQSSSLDTYIDLDALRNYYFEKYESNYDWTDYIRLIKFFDNSLFKTFQDFIPARTSLASGIIIKNTVLDRNRYRTPQVNISESIAMIGSGSTNIPYIVEDQTITGSIISGFITGSNGGVMPNLFGQTSSVYDYNNVVNITQSWNGTIPSVSGSIPFTQTSQDEFFNGEISGSNLVVTNGELSDCNVTLQQVFTVSGIVLDGSSPGGEVNYYIPSQYLNVDKTYYFTFTVTADAGNSYAGKIFLNQQDPQRNLYTSIDIAAGNSLTVNTLEINNPLNPLFFFIQEALDPGIDTFTFTLDLTIFESYIEPDCLVIENDAQVNRPSNKYFDVDFATSQIVAVNKENILSGSATPATVPDSYYTTARIINPRYVGSKNTSPDFNIISGSQLPSVEQSISYFAYTPGGLGNTLATRSGSGNYKIGFLVDELGTIFKPETSGSTYLPNFYNAFGTNSPVILSPTNNQTLNQVEYTVYKPAVLGNTIIYSDTGSLGTDNLISGFYTTMSFSAIESVLNDPSSLFGLSINGNGQVINAGSAVTASFTGTILQDLSLGWKSSTSPIPPTSTFTFPSSSNPILINAYVSSSLEIDNIGASSTNITVSLFKNNNLVTAISSSVNTGNSDVYNIDYIYRPLSGDVIYFTVESDNEDISIVSANKLKISQVTTSSIISTPYFTTGSVIESVLTSSIDLGSVYGGGYKQNPITGSGFNIPPAFIINQYDEIRFNGNENKVSLIVSSSYDNNTNLLYLYLNNPIDTTSVNVNYFAIRKWDFTPSNLIINTPGTIMSEGLILPKYPSPLLQQNLPSIVENLTNKGLI